MGEWIKSGVLDSVDQIGMEMHTGRVHIQPDRHVRVLKDLIGYFQGGRGRVRDYSRGMPISSIL